MRQMAWLHGSSPKFKILHLNVNGSGWATYQKLRSEGCELVETGIAENMREPALVGAGNGGGQ